MELVKKSLLMLFIVANTLTSAPAGLPVVVELKPLATKTIPVQPKPNIQKKHAKIIRLTRVSFYQAKPSQSDANPSMSACGKTKAPWRQIAVSRELFRKLGCGKAVILHLPNKKVKAVVWDTMHSRYRNSADVLVGNNEPAYIYGVKKGILEVITE
ncbi:MAG: hypothetical protein JTT14_00190, partial [Candidatus Brockarchaeota archaeon]|nr:hypothetical protein [Candidatus Brockarchaeota archaeon]